MSAQSQTPLFSQSAELVELIKIRKRMIVLLQGVGQMAFCKATYVDGKQVGPGCGREVYWITLRGGRPAPFDEDGARHKCPSEIKP